MTAPKLRFKEFDGDWTQSKIGEIFQVTSGSTPLRSDNRFFENADIAWVKTTDLNNGLIEKTEEKISQIALKETSVKILPKGTVFVAMYGGFNQIGRTGLLVDDAACNQALSAIYPNEKIDSYFLLTFLNHKVDDWKNFAASSRKDPNITKSDVLAFPLTYPVKEEQTKIASFLSAVDEKISQLTQKHALLSQYKQGMMQKLFSQQLRFKANDGSEFGEWVEKKIIDVADYVDYRGKTPKKVENGVLLVTAKNIRFGYIDYEVSQEYICSEDFDEVMRRGRAEIGDVLITTEAPLGNVALIDREGIALAQRVIKYRGKNVILNNEFLKQKFLSEDFQALISSKATGGTVQGIKGSTLHNLEIHIPHDIEEQTKIANFLSSIDQKIEVVEQQIEQAKTWKKGLLQQMFV